MEQYKKDFIDFLLAKNALRIGDFTLKSGRKSPYFINTGMFDDGESIGRLGYFYAAKINDQFKTNDYDLIFGPAYKGIPLSVATSVALSKDFKINKGYLFDRKVPKDHGEGTAKDIQKNWIVGSKIEDSSRLIMIDDVFTTGGTKYDTIELLKKISDSAKFVGLIIAVDRMETGVDGKNAIAEFTAKTSIPVHAIVTIREIIDYLGNSKKITESDKQRLEDYLTQYRT
ncbi:orotate phosphoribosyltransferase [bacterium]|nr:orotate phosphoribosyltransferase [bacterium]